MTTNGQQEMIATASWSTVHPQSPADKAAMAAMRAIVEPHKGRLQGVAARAPFDAIMERVAAPADVTYEADTVGGVPGWWCRPQNARAQSAILHLHGGWFNWGSARAFRHLVGHIAARSGAVAFVPDYRLAPEHPFPAAPHDVRKTYAGLVDQGFTKIAVTGDSAGGNLALGLLSFLSENKSTNNIVPVGVVALSPVTDLTLNSPSWESRAGVDPYFVKFQVAELVRSYLNGHDAADPLASPLNAVVRNLCPIRVHVGDAEVLLDDSIRFVERAMVQGVDAELHIWEGMPHGFLGAIGPLQAAATTLGMIGNFLLERFQFEV